MNVASIVSKWHLPRIDEALVSLDERRTDSTFDLTSEFFRNEIHPVLVMLTALITPLCGLYQWL